MRKRGPVTGVKGTQHCTRMRTRSTVRERIQVVDLTSVIGLFYHLNRPLLPLQQASFTIATGLFYHCNPFLPGIYEGYFTSVIGLFYHCNRPLLQGKHLEPQGLPSWYLIGLFHQCNRPLLPLQQASFTREAPGAWDCRQRERRRGKPCSKRDLFM